MAGGNLIGVILQALTNCTKLRDVNLMAFSHLATQIERANPKLLSRGEDRSSLKYITKVFLSDFEYFIEKKFGLLTRVWVSVLGGPKLLLRGQTLGAKSTKKCCHVGTLEAFHLWSLATSVKAQRSTSWLSTKHIAGFLHLSNRPAKCKDPLSDNTLRSAIPFQSLKKLTLLLLQNNLQEGDFITRVPTFSYLKDLDLINNRLNGSIPAKVGNVLLQTGLLFG